MDDGVACSRSTKTRDAPAKSSSPSFSRSKPGRRFGNPDQMVVGSLALSCLSGWTDMVLNTGFIQPIFFRKHLKSCPKKLIIYRYLFELTIENFYPRIMPPLSNDHFNVMGYQDAPLSGIADSSTAFGARVLDGSAAFGALHLIHFWPKHGFIKSFWN